jgi:hypothetical protein
MLIHKSTQVLVESSFEFSQGAKCLEGEPKLKIDKDMDFGEDDIENELEESFGSNEEKMVKASKQVFYEIQNMVH